mmetsp:Transcript_14383/g.21291  ORF Transcript_14383/g.21291 Transcript_14383/m.21291 type:complete len:218 (+) Transcript_14383:74-727(+)
MSTPLASTDAQPNIDVLEVDTDGTTGVLPATTEEALEADALPLAEEDLEGDVVIYATTPSTGRNWKRPAFLLALVSLLVIAISVGVSNRNKNNKGNVAAVQTQQVKQPLPPKGPKKEAAAADGIVEAPKAAPVKPAKPPKKQEEQFITPYPTDEGMTAVSTEVTAPPTVASTEVTAPPTVYPTDEGTTTVSTEVTAPPTVANRPAGSSVIESPTWRG